MLGKSSYRMIYFWMKQKQVFTLCFLLFCISVINKWRVASILFQVDPSILSYFEHVIQASVTHLTKPHITIDNIFLHNPPGLSMSESVSPVSIHKVLPWTIQDCSNVSITNWNEIKDENYSKHNVLEIFLSRQAQKKKTPTSPSSWS